MSNQAARTEPVLRIENLTRKFGEVIAVDDVSLAVEEGELRSIIGPNGAGKTTFFNLIAGVLSPTAGSIHFQRDEISDEPLHRRSQIGIGRSYQNNELFAELTVLENVRVAAQTAELGDFSFDMFSRADGLYEDSAKEILERVDLLSERNIEAQNLSHGDQRRLGIAIALATDPDLLLLDEPTSGMGPEATKATAELIAEVKEDIGLTVILIEHDMSVVMEMSDRISVLYDGTHIATGSPAEIRENQDVQDAYLGGMREEGELEQ